MELTIVLLALAGLLLMIVPQVKALDIKSAAPCWAAAGGDTVTYAMGPYTRHYQVPDAVLLWSGDGAVFWVRRAIGSAANWEDVEIKIPANSSLLIPTSTVQISSTEFYAHFEFGAAAVTDSVYALPLKE